MEQILCNHSPDIQTSNRISRLLDDKGFPRLSTLTDSTGARTEPDNQSLASTPTLLQ
ncbi:hypothetical protein [Paenibacillus polymyxa]|uniref:hypothetical protein n=1 Tax=Paenibacillus polymyxa TaxID=1406 RepID=UPI001E2F347E|nr:hypothetical protein [Paenibacillus polymyxa]